MWNGSHECDRYKINPNKKVKNRASLDLPLQKSVLPYAITMQGLSFETILHSSIYFCKNYTGLVVIQTGEMFLKTKFKIKKLK